MANSEVRNDRRTRLMGKIILGQLAFGILISVISLSLIAYGLGYRLDTSNFKIVKTSVVYFEFSPRDVTISINGESDTSLTSYVKNIRPGLYNIVISKSGYTPWTEQLRAESGAVYDFRKIVLFSSNIIIDVLSDQSKINQVNAPVDILAANSPGELSNSDYEIWIGDKLVTRFSEPIKSAIWYPDLNHIVYQQGNQIRVIEADGQNDTLLVTLTSSAKTRFAIGGRGAEIYYLDGDLYKVATIR